MTRPNPTAFGLWISQLVGLRRSRVSSFYGRFRSLFPKYLERRLADEQCTIFAEHMSRDKHSYGQTVRSLFIMGGAAGVTYLAGLVRNKMVAILLGPSGVGLIGLYSSAMLLIGTISSLGIVGSAVREVAVASAEEDARAIGRTFRILQRACWATGILGWLLAMLLARPLSVYLFASPKHAAALSILGGTLLLNSLCAGRQALLQGLRRVGDVARVNVLGALLSTIVATGLLAWLGENGIVPALATTATISLALAYAFSRKIQVASVRVSLGDTLRGSRNLLGLGVAFMLITVNSAALDALTRSIVVNGFGLEAAGIYQSAWALSGTFAGVVLAAMGTDFYPRLSAVIHDNATAARVVNQHLEIGILMALPGILAALLFAPLCMRLVFSDQFLGGAELLRWLMLGVFCKVLAWPLAFIPLAKGASRLVLGVDLVLTSIQVVFLFWLERVHELAGVAQAVTASVALQVLISMWVARVLIDFTLSRGVVRLAVVSVGLIATAFVIPLFMDGAAGSVAGAFMTLTGSIISLRGLAARLGAGNLLNRWVSYVPGGWIVLVGIDA